WSGRSSATRSPTLLTTLHQMSQSKSWEWHSSGFLRTHTLRGKHELGQHGHAGDLFPAADLSRLRAAAPGEVLGHDAAGLVSNCHLSRLGCSHNQTARRVYGTR